MAAILEAPLPPVCEPAEGSSAELEPRERLLSREDYLRMGEAGILAPNERVELIRGRIYTMAPQDLWHMGHVTNLRETVRRAFGPGFVIFEEKPIVMPDESEPEPDIAVVRGGPLDFLSRKPTGADVLLLVEAADSSLGFDRKIKSSLYAQAGVQDYWILNRRDQCLEVMRDPTETYAYRSLQICTRGMTVSPLARPEASFHVEELLPELEATPSEE
jgi:Uma2 family endonuclease